jgi:hypothetical protein
MSVVCTHALSRTELLEVDGSYGVRDDTTSLPGWIGQLQRQEMLLEPKGLKRGKERGREERRGEGSGR